MPVIPLAPTLPAPNLAQSFLGGARLAQDAEQHAQTLQFQRQKLAQDAQQAEMQFQAQSAAAERQQLRQQQEMELSKAYQQAQIGLKQQELQESEKVLQFKVGQAAQQAAVQMQAQRRISAGEDPQKVWMELGPMAGVKLPAEMFRKPMGRVTAAPLLDESGNPTGKMQAPSGFGSTSIFTPPPSSSSAPTVQSIPGVKGKVMVNNKIVSAPEESNVIQNKIDVLREKQASDFGGLAAAKKQSRKEKLDEGDKISLGLFNDRRDRIDELKKQLQGGPTTTATAVAPYKEGQKIQNKKTGKIYVVRNGEPVEVKE